MNTFCKSRILIAGEEDDIVRSMSMVLSGDGYAVISAGTAEYAGSIVEGDDVDAVITDVALPGSEGLRFFEYVSAMRPGLPVILLTGRDTVETARAAMRHGAFYYFIKPPDYPSLRSIIARAVEQRRFKRQIGLPAGRLPGMSPQYHIIGSTPEMQRIAEIIESIKDSSCSVLITGEAGTGKELIARALHYRSLRAAMPFVTVNCAAVPDELMDTELFGCEEGAFEGAISCGMGKFEAAAHGVAFLDEIGEMGLAMQKRLVWVLRDGEFKRVGSNGKLRVGFRLVTASKTDLTDGVRKGSFREDLYRMISVSEIRVPPLRERKDDIPLLVSAFLNEFGRKLKKEIALSNEVVAAFQRHPWPGNIRQLRNVLDNAADLARGHRITLEELPGNFMQKKAIPGRASVKTLKELETQAIRETFIKCNGNKSRTARVLGISRKTFYRRLKESD
jgi:DNA-binding NtrC family response regulator